ncbi:MAG: VWA domain-containing protein [Acidobacteriota bacterium]
MRNLSTILPLGWVFICMTSALATAQQEPPETEFKGRIEVTEVLLDVVVTDASGNLILGLKPEDFIIHDGDREVNATSATFYSNRRFVDSGLAATRAGVSPSEIPSDRYFIFLFHDQRFEDPELTSNILDALRWTKDWVEYESLENDWVAIASYDVKLKIHQDFTTSRQLLLEALTSVAKSKDPGSEWPSRIKEETGPSLRKNLPQGRELSKQTRRVYSAIDLLAESAGHITGRKNILLFSMGWGKIDTRNFNTYIPDVRYYPTMVESLNDNNVAVYSISWAKNASRENVAQSYLGNLLSDLSNDTGGIYYFNFVTFKDPLLEVTQDNNGYYLLSYEAEYEAGDKGYREVSVETRNPNFKVRARKGYRYGV